MEVTKTSGARSALLAAFLAGTGKQSNTVTRSIKSALLSGVLAIAALLILPVVAPQAANAAESPYCGGWLGAKTTCSGAARWTNAQYGSGQQGSVCVGNGYSGAACSGGPGQGIYKPVGATINQEPWISNNMWSGNNLVQGIAFTP
jgi:hypothetical protein